MLGKIGVVMLVFSLVWCGASLLLPQLFSPLGQSYCTEGETYQGEVRTTSSPTRATIGTTHLCVNTAGNQRSIREQMEFTTTMIFLVLLFGSFGLMAFGVNGIAKSPSSPKQKPRKLKDDDEQGTSLASKLGELEEARFKELISEDEYQRLRKEALDDVI